MVATAGAGGWPGRWGQQCSQPGGRLGELQRQRLHPPVAASGGVRRGGHQHVAAPAAPVHPRQYPLGAARAGGGDRKSTRLNSSHITISYAVFCLKKKKNKKK